MLTTIFCVSAFCFILERAVPGWPLPQVRTWPVRVLLINAAQLGVVLLAGLTWERWLSSASMFRLSDHVSPETGGLIAYFIATFVFYWWHRWRHEHDALWRGFHQIHHSPRRLEVITSFYKHPGEMVANSLIGSLLVYSLLGLSLEAGAVYTLCTALGEFFYHTNIRTPRSPWPTASDTNIDGRLSHEWSAEDRRNLPGQVTIGLPADKGATMPTQDEEIARHLRQALESGELAAARGFGQPLPQDEGWNATPEALRMPFKILKDAGYVPPEVELFHQRAALSAALEQCGSDPERCELQRQLSELEQKIALRLEALRSNGTL